MITDNSIAKRIADAKADRNAEDELIRDYMPFIRAEAAKFLHRTPDSGDDEMSIAMLAFHEAVHGYDEAKGTFISFASRTIQNRFIDHYRKEKRHVNNISIHTTNDETGTEMADMLTDDEECHSERLVIREATRQEIAELSEQMATFGVSLSDVADNCPKQERNKKICLAAMNRAKSDSSLLDEFLRTKKLPLAKLSEGNNAVRKTLERHRKYLIALLLICTNGYEIIRGHLKQVLRGGEI